MTAGLREKAVSAAMWSGLDTFFRQGVQFGITMILARLLSPIDYGTIGLLSIFMGLVGVFINCGFPSALIQRAHVDQTELSSVFFLNIIIAVITTTILVLIAPLVADFYHIPVLTPLTKIMAVTLFIGSFGSIQTTILTKSLNFRRQCSITIISIIASGAVAVVLAWNQFGVWSLALSSLVATIVSTALLWITSAWRPSLVFSLPALQSLFAFSSYIMFSNLLDALFSRLNTIVIGKFYSPQELGYFSRADGTQQLPSSLISNVISRVAFPVFSAANEDKELLRTGLRKAISVVMMVNIPLMLGMAVTARHLVELLFGHTWVPCVPYLQILCLGGVLWPLHVLNLNVLKAQGRSDLFFRLEVWKKVMGILFLGVACWFGMAAIAWSAVAMSVASFVVNAYYSDSFLKYGPIDQIVDLLPFFTASLIMTAFISGISLLPIQMPILSFSFQVLGGVAIYLGTCWVMKPLVFIEVLTLVLDKISFSQRFSRTE